MKITKYLSSLLIITLFNCNLNTSKVEKYDKRIGYTKKFGATDSIPEIDINANNTPIKISIPNDIDEKSIRIDTITNSLIFVKLETNKNCLISIIDNLLFIEDKIIVVDKNNRQKKAFIFSSKGKFIAQIGNIGKGPHEYIHLSNILIDYENNQILILDGVSQNIFYYDLFGKLIKKRKSYYYIARIGMLNNHFVIHQIKDNNLHLPNLKEHQIIVADSSWKIIKKAFTYNFPVYNPKIYIYNKHSFNIMGNRILYSPLYTNSIYEFNGFDNVKLKYILDLGDKDILNRLGDYKSHEERDDAFNTKKMWGFSGLALEAGDYLYSKVNNAGFFFYNTISEKLIYGNSISYHTSVKDKDLLPKFPNNIQNPLASTGSHFVSVVYPSGLFYAKKDKTTRSFRNISGEIKISDNPVLIFYSLKK